jgi:2-oxoglutarate ferredoxin oxidoreductase subunit gamma
MTEEIIIAGFGGQGVLSMGKMLAYSAIMQHLEACWMPAYGPEMRGGTCNVMVSISHDKISSPVLRCFDTAIILNQPSMDKFESAVKPGGVLMYDPNGITRTPTRKDIRIFAVSATEEATRMNEPRIFNMIVLGAYLSVKPFLGLDHVVEGLHSTRKHSGLVWV